MLGNDSIDADKLIEFIDNLKAHHSSKTTAWIEEHADRIKLFHLPFYSPEYNPDEYLNHDLKESIGTKPQVKTNDELQGLADDFMGKLSCEAEHIQSYFDHPSLDCYGIIKN